MHDLTKASDGKRRSNRTRCTAPRGLSSSFDFIRADEEIGWNFPCLADLIDHVDCKGTPAGENFRCTRPRTQELGQFCQAVPEFVDGVRCAAEGKPAASCRPNEKSKQN